MDKNGIHTLNIENNGSDENLGQVKRTREIIIGSSCDHKLIPSKILPCSHKFCLICLKKQEEEQVNGKIKCSTCDIDHEIPSGGIINFPTNIKIKKRLSLKESTFKNNEDNTQLECPICYENLENPRYLPCFHKFCIECVHKMEQESLNGKIKCPLCRKEHLVTLDGQNISNFPPVITSNESLIYPQIQSNNINQTIPPVFSTNHQIEMNRCKIYRIVFGVFYSHLSF
jgi:hypothetical protein